MSTRMRGRTLSVFLVLALALVGSSFAAKNRTFAAPTITSFTPTSGIAGTKIYITGTNLGGATVEFNGIAVATDGFVVNAAGTRITVTVPGDVATGLNPITVTTPEGTATAPASFTVTISSGMHATGLRPHIVGVTPKRAMPGAKVTVTGSNFGGATIVKLGGVKASFRIPSTTKILLTVPAKAKTGRISVKTRLGTALSSAKVTVLPAVAG